MEGARLEAGSPERRFLAVLQVRDEGGPAQTQEMKRSGQIGNVFWRMKERDELGIALRFLAWKTGWHSIGRRVLNV